MKQDNIYKYILPTVLTLFPFATLVAQNIPVAPVSVQVTPAPLPAGYTIPTINSVRSWEAKMPSTDPAIITSGTRTSGEVRQVTEYIDGLGRLIQKVYKGSSGQGKDQVEMELYDQFNRVSLKYLPYTQTDGNTNNGAFKADPFRSQRTFYRNPSLNPGVANDSIFYARVEFEPSPMNRVIKRYSAGNSWAKEGGNRPVETRYLLNKATDEVRIWNITSGLPLSPGTYQPGLLTKQVEISENGRQTIEYKDKSGKTILKKVQLQDVPGNSHSGWLNVYYVYDDMDNLRFVITPKAVEAILSNWTLTQEIANNLCFVYEYDGRKRAISKKIPGAAPIEMVYDVNDRLLFSRDGNMKAAGQWLASVYDAMNRTVMTGTYNSTMDRATLQAAATNAAGTNQSVSYSFPAADNLYLNNYDGSTLYTAKKSIEFLDAFESTDNATFETNLSESAVSGSSVISTTNNISGLSSADFTPLTYTFYDDYSYTGAHAFFASDIPKPEAGSNNYAAPLPSTPSKMTRGLVTGSKIRVLGTDQWLTTTNYYDEKGRVIQVTADNHTGGKEISTRLYNFGGDILSVYQRHTNPRSVVTPQTTVLTMFEYGTNGQLVKTRKRLNDDVNLERTLSENIYNESGQTSRVRIGINASNVHMDQIDYEYNLKGWLVGINKSFVATTGSTTNWFGEELSYDKGFLNPQYNGNVAGMKWKSGGDGQARAYGFSYDNSNRLLLADYTQQNGSAWDRNTVDYSVKNLIYDANGNIRNMRQEGMTGTAKATIDDLTYTYASNSNQLISVQDPSSTATAQLGDFQNGSNTGDDYSYDANGNMMKDLNKGITSITYNKLNLPELITVQGKGTISYLYDASGIKLRKTVTDNTVNPSKVTVTDYMESFIYKQDSIELINHENGRIRPLYASGQPLSYTFDYFEKDHLGNIRVVLTEQTTENLYAATMETTSATTENSLFSNIDATRVQKPAGYPADNTTPQNNFVAKLNAKAGANKIGPSLVLRVMAGDTVKISSRAFYKSQGPDQKNRASTEDMVAGLIQAFGGSAGGDNAHANRTAAVASPFNNDFYNNNYQQLKQRDAGTPATGPKAYLNFISFNDKFEMVENNSGVRSVKNEPDALQDLKMDGMVVDQTGFLYVFTSNETEQDVYFDNLLVSVNAGPLLEESHYYPFGLQMAGLGTNALKGANYPTNRYLFNGKEFNAKEFSDGSGLDWYSYGMREYNPQIGRFFRIDPLAKDFVHLTPYQYAGNDPIRNIDIDGLEPTSSVESWDLSTLQSHTYANGQKIYYIDNYWVSMQRGEYNTVYQYYDKEQGDWMSFPPKTNADLYRSRADALYGLSDGLGKGFAGLFYTGAAAFTGGFSLQGLTAQGLGGGLGDATAQYIFSTKDGFVNRLKDINITSVGASILFKNPFGASFVANALDYRLNEGFYNSFAGGQKSAKDFAIDFIAFGAAGRYANAGLDHLGASGVSAMRSFINAGLNKTGVVTLHFGAGGLTSAQLNILANLISNALKENTKEPEQNTNKAQ